MTDPDTVARNRFIIIQIVRISGVALVLFGLMVLTDRTDLPREAGYGFAVVGLFEALLAPLLLSRKWKTPSE